jgi:hypothetical protein
MTAATDELILRLEDKVRHAAQFARTTHETLDEAIVLLDALLEQLRKEGDDG